MSDPTESSQPNCPQNCPQCGVELPTDAVAGLCPKCLLQLGFESEPNVVGATNPYQPKFLAPPPEQLAPYFPEYEILELIGHGGMGVVYKARQKELDRFVALKILRPDIDKDPSFAERFQREARTLAQLNHPNIITIHNFGRKDDLYFLVMEYIDGTNLRQLEQTAQLQPTEALAIVPKICEALQYAHENGVVHRDIKPENILITQDGRIKIADFGLAKLSGVPEQFSLTGTWQVMGTPHYMAPEQFERPSEVDHRADIFSLGVVIYEMLTGELPLGRFPLPSEKSTADKRLDDVVQRALDKDPDNRYQQASEVQTAVEEISSTPGKAPDDPSKLNIFYAMGKGLSPFISFWRPSHQTALEEAVDPKLQRERDLSRLRKGALFIYFLALANVFFAIVMFLIFPINLFFAMGLVSGPVIFALSHLILKRQKLQLAQWLTVVTCIPVSVISVVNILFMIPLYILWKPGMKEEFDEIPWKETYAAHQFSEIRKWFRAYIMSFFSLLKHLLQKLKRGLRLLLPVAVGVAMWSGLWGVTAYVTEEHLMDRYAPSGFRVSDTSAGIAIPASGAYAGIEIFAHGEGRSIGKEIRGHEPRQSHLKMTITPKNSGDPRRVEIEFSMTDSVPTGIIQKRPRNSGKELSTELLNTWMGEAGVDVAAPLVQKEIFHLEQLVREYLEADGIEKDAAGHFNVLSAATMINQKLFLMENQGRIRLKTWIDKSVYAITEMTAALIWVTGVLVLLFLLFRARRQQGNRGLEAMDRTRLLKSLRWPGRGLIACGLIGIATVFLADWFLFRSAWRPGIPELQTLSNNPYHNPILIGLLCCFLLMLVAGFKVQSGRRRLWRWIGMLAAILAMILPPWNLVGFPVGFATLVLLLRPEMRDLFANRIAVVETVQPEEPTPDSLR